MSWVGAISGVALVLIPVLAICGATDRHLAERRDAGGVWRLAGPFGYGLMYA